MITGLAQGAFSHHRSSRARWKVPAFAAYIRKVLIAEVVSGKAVILDNHATQRNKDAVQAPCEYGYWLLRLSPYSPDQTQIEQARSRLNAQLRKIGAQEPLPRPWGNLRPCTAVERWIDFKAARYASG